ncbi:hypothetical protein R75461_03741 [Paraburkholderia nemoris]|nr:hypothetical protein [Paraburkholderia aspalathi]MBK3778724.1 hypothetical protein [Paraburkholderia aspalathi]CAE6769042.1 hypothetical protein R75461_03741 [Paraburkholderia nemoris]
MTNNVALTSAISASTLVIATGDRTGLLLLQFFASANRRFPRSGMHERELYFLGFIAGVKRDGA